MDYVLQHVATSEQRHPYSTGPSLLSNDRTYRGERIPLRFYKIAVWLGEQRLPAFGSVLDQPPLVQRICRLPS